MKKAISIVITVCILLASITTAMFSNVLAAEPAASVACETFDNYTINPAWSCAATVSADQKALCWESDKMGYIFVYNSENISKAYVEQGKTYTLHMSVRVMNMSGPLWYYIADNENGLSASVAPKNTYLVFNSAATEAIRDEGGKFSSLWQERTFEFTADKSGYLAVGKHTGTLNAWFDNFRLCEKADSTISFSGSTLEAKTGAAGASIGELPTPIAPNGKKFDGWYTDADLTKAFTDAYYPAGNITLYAKWQVGDLVAEDFENYTVDPAWGAAAIAADQKDNTNKALYFEQDKTGSAFVYNNENIEKAYVEAGKTYTLHMNVRVMKMSGAIWYEIVADKNSLSSTANPANSQLIFNSAATEAIRDADGKESSNWQEKVFEFTAPKSGYLAVCKKTGTLNAWFDNFRLCEKGNSTISFVTNSDDTVEAKTGAAGAKIGELPSLTSKDGSKYAVWFADEGLTKPFAGAYYPAGNITLYAKWNANEYTVTYKVGDDVIGTETVEHGKDAKLLDVPAKDGYTGKWDSDGKNITKDTVINAVYTKKPARKPETDKDDKADKEDVDKDSEKESDKSDDQKSPQTGDSSNVALVLALLFISGGTMIKLCVVDRKRRTASTK